MPLHGLSPVWLTGFDLCAGCARDWWWGLPVSVSIEENIAPLEKVGIAVYSGYLLPGNSRIMMPCG